MCDFMALHLGLVQTRTNWIDMRRKMVPKKSILHPKRVKVFLGGSLVHSSILELQCDGSLVHSSILELQCDDRHIKASIGLDFSHQYFFLKKLASCALET